MLLHSAADYTGTVISTPQVAGVASNADMTAASPLE